MKYVLCLSSNAVFILVMSFCYFSYSTIAFQYPVFIDYSGLCDYFAE